MRQFKRWFVPTALALLGLAACGTAHNPEGSGMMSGASGCKCQGATLICGAPSLSIQNSAFCDQAQLNNAGVCACTGQQLNCSFTVCHYKVPSSMCPGINADDLYGPCKSASLTSNVYGKGEGYSGTNVSISFADSPQCAPPPAGKLAPPVVSTVIGSGACFDFCDPAAPNCVGGTSCQQRADGTHICFDKNKCSKVDAPPGQPPSCECQGTALVCTNGATTDPSDQCVQAGTDNKKTCGCSGPDLVCSDGSVQSCAKKCGCTKP